MPKTGIFKPGDEQQVFDRIRRLHDRVLAFTPHGITEEEFEEMLVPAEHRQIARDAVRVLDLSAAWSYRFKHPLFATAWSVTGVRHFKFYYPHRDTRRLNKESAGFKKMMAWHDRRMQIGEEWGLVRAVFKELHERCKRQDYVRFYWPPIVTLLGNSETAAKLAHYRPCSNPTPIPVELRTACRETMNTITKASILPPKEAAPKQAFELQLEDMGKFMTPWGVGESRY